MPEPRKRRSQDEEDAAAAQAARRAGGTSQARRAEGEDADRLRRRARFLRELHEAKALRERVQPRRARVARMRQAMRMRTFRW